MLETFYRLTTDEVLSLVSTDFVQKFGFYRKLLPGSLGDYIHQTIGDYVLDDNQNIIGIVAD